MTANVPAATPAVVAVPVALALAASLSLAFPPAAAAQAPGATPRPPAAAPKPPEVVADELQRAFESMAWAGAAQRLHPDALARFRAVVTMLVETDARGEVRDELLGGVPAADYPGLAAEEVFRRVMTSLMDEAPGLTHALVTRRHEIVGTVAEGADSAHVVYRLLPTLQGAEAEVKVMTLARADGPGRPWRVLRSDELEVIRAALRGIPVGIPAPPAPTPADTSGLFVPVPAADRRPPR